jgi:hypothetical protein
MVQVIRAAYIKADFFLLSLLMDKALPAPAFTNPYESKSLTVILPVSGIAII